MRFSPSAPSTGSTISPAPNAAGAALAFRYGGDDHCRRSGGQCCHYRAVTTMMHHQVAAFGHCATGQISCVTKVRRQSTNFCRLLARLAPADHPTARWPRGPPRLSQWVSQRCHTWIAGVNPDHELVVTQRSVTQSAEFGSRSVSDMSCCDGQLTRKSWRSLYLFALRTMPLAVHCQQHKPLVAVQVAE